MDKKIILLPGMKFMSGGVLYKPGDILPDTDDARELVQKGKAVLVNRVENETPNEKKVYGEPDESADGYEKQKVKDLADLARARGINLPSGANKTQIVELLRAGDAQNEGAS